MSGSPGRLLRSLETRARRSLGQHFLVNTGVASQAVRVAGVGEGSRVLEIGPGLGALTRELLAAGAHVVAVERDETLARWVQETWPQVEVVAGDAMAISFDEILPGGGWTCVSNLPYNVGTHLVGRMVRAPGTFSRLVVMLQREVAARLCSARGTKSYGALSVEVQARAQASLAMVVRPGSFRPAPKVDSAIVVLEIDHLPDTGGAPPEVFDRAVRAAFSKRRKVLRNSRGAAYGREAATRALALADISPRARAEELGIDDFRRMARAFHEISGEPPPSNPDAGA